MAEEKLKENFRKIIQGKILSGELKPGDRLPTERELADKFGISRSSVNQGIADLERMGFLHIVSRHGTFVADYVHNATPQTISAILSYDSALIDKDLFSDLMSLRILIERECVRLACINMNEKHKSMLEKNTERLHNTAGRNLEDALYDYHQCLTKISGNSAYEIVYCGFELMLRNMIHSHFENEDEIKTSLPLYEKLSSAIENCDTEQADNLISRILLHAAEYLDIKMKR